MSSSVSRHFLSLANGMDGKTAYWVDEKDGKLDNSYKEDINSWTECGEAVKFKGTLLTIGTLTGQFSPFPLAFWKRYFNPSRKEFERIGSLSAKRLVTLGRVKQN